MEKVPKEQKITKSKKSVSKFIINENEINNTKNTNCFNEEYEENYDSEFDSIEKITK
jgi:hypothetical protein